MSASMALAATRPRRSGIRAAISGSRSGKLMRPLRHASARRPATRAALCAHSVLLPAPRHTTMSPAAATRLSARRDLALVVDGCNAAMPGRPDRLRQGHVIDAVDRQLACGIERRDDDAVGVLEAGGELGEQIAHARVAVRLDDGDDAPSRAGARRLQHGGDLDGMVAVVVVDGNAVPGAGRLEAALDAGEARERLAQGIVADARLAARGDRRQGVEGVVMADERHAPASNPTGTAAHARAEISVEEGLPALDARRFEHEVSASRHTVGQKPAPVAPQLQALQHVGNHRMVDAGHAQSVERDIAEEDLELAMHVLDGLEVVEMLGVDVGDDADLARNLDEGAVGFVGLHDHPLAVAEARVRSPLVDDAAGDHRRVEPRGLEDMGDERCRSGFSVRSRHRHGGIEAHQLGQHLGAANDGVALGAGGLELGIRAFDGGRDDDVARADQVDGIMPDEHADALEAQAPDVGAVLLIAALHGVALGVQDLGDGAHADAADAENVHGPHLVRHLHQLYFPRFSSCAARLVNSSLTRFFRLCLPAPRPCRRAGLRRPAGPVLWRMRRRIPAPAVRRAAW